MLNDMLKITQGHRVQTRGSDSRVLLSHHDACPLLGSPMHQLLSLGSAFGVSTTLSNPTGNTLSSPMGLPQDFQDLVCIRASQLQHCKHVGQSFFPTGDCAVHHRIVISISSLCPPPVMTTKLSAKIAKCSLGQQKSSLGGNY